MLRESNCYKRRCHWYKGASQPEGSELNEFHYCNAFPNGIPRDISYGDNEHLEVIEGQEGDYTYEPSRG